MLIHPVGQTISVRGSGTIETPLPVGYRGELVSADLTSTVNQNIG